LSWLAAVSGLLFLCAPLLWFFPPRGIQAYYYTNPGWRGKPYLEVRDARVSLGRFALKKYNLPTRNFSVTWWGFLRVDRPGQYTFATASDDGSALWVDTQRVVENGGWHANRKRSGSLFLTPGLHEFRVSFFQAAGSYELAVTWARGESAETAIPASHLYPKHYPGVLIFLNRHAGKLWVFFGLVSLILLIARRYASGRAPAWRNLALNTAISLVTVLLMFLLGELAMRFYQSVLLPNKSLQTLLKESEAADISQNKQTYNLKGIVKAAKHADVVYELKSNLRGYFRDKPLSTNSAGMRDREYSTRKPQGVFRIAALGDSSLFGWGVEQEEISVELLENKLNSMDLGTRIEVLNFAVPGYNTAIEAALLERKVLAFAPDLVLINFNSNDFDVPGFMRLPQRKGLWRRSYVLDFIVRSLRSIHGAREQEIVPFGFDQRTINLYQADRLDEDPALPEQFRYMVGTKGFNRAVERLARIAETHDLPIVFFDVISYPGLDENYRENPLRVKQLRMLQQVAQRRHFYFLNTYPHYIAFQQEHPDLAYPRVFMVTDTDSHPSALAHRINCTVLLQYLLDQNLLPGRPR